MIDELDKIKRKLRKEFEDTVDINEDSDILISEKKVKYKKIKEI